MKNRIIAILLTLCLSFPMGIVGVFADTDINAEQGENTEQGGDTEVVPKVLTLYVKEGAAGDGSSAESALPDIKSANEIAKSAEGDVVIRLVGEVGLDFTKAEYVEPAHENKITWTGDDESSKLKVYTKYGSNYYYSLGGVLAVEKLSIEVVSTPDSKGNHLPFTIVTQLHDITFGEQVSIVNSASARNTCNIFGVNAGKNEVFYDAESNKDKADPTVTIMSGQFRQIAGYMANYNITAVAANSKEVQRALDGTLTVNLGGTASVDRLYAVCNSFNTVRDFDLNISGGTINEYAGATDRPYFHAKDRSMTGPAKAWGMSGVTGKMTVSLTGNYDLSAQSSIPCAATAFNGLCGTTLNANYAGALEDDKLGTFVLRMIPELAEAVLATDKINLATFHEFKQINGTSPDTDVEFPDEVLYVRDGSDGDGSSPESALPTVMEAMEKAATMPDNVTIMLCGEVGIDTTVKSIYEPAHANRITLSAYDDSSKLIITTSSAKKYNYILGGEVRFKDLPIVIDGDRPFTIITQLQDITFDEGVSITNPKVKGNTATCTIVGINSGATSSVFFDKTDRLFKADPTITLKSGNFYQVVGFMINNNGTNLGAAGMAINLDGKLTINLGGTASVDRLFAVCNAFNTVRDFDLNITGGTINEYAGATDRPYTHKSSRSIKKFGLSGVTGEMKVTISGDYDPTAQSKVKCAATAFNGLCGSTLNKAYAGALADDRLGKFILEIDKSIYDKYAATLRKKINYATFDKVLIVDPADPDNPKTGDNTPMIAVVCIGSMLTAAAVIMLPAVFKKRRKNSI